MIISQGAIYFEISQLNNKVSMLSSLLSSLEADLASYDEEGAYTVKAYKNKVALEQAIEALQTAVNNLTDIAVD